MLGAAIVWRQGQKPSSLAARAYGKQKGGRPKATSRNRVTDCLYAVLRRRRLSQPNPTSAVPSRAREEGSGINPGGAPISCAIMKTCSKPLFSDAPAGHPGKPLLTGPL